MLQQNFTPGWERIILFMNGEINGEISSCGALHLQYFDSTIDYKFYPALPLQLMEKGYSRINNNQFRAYTASSDGNNFYAALPLQLMELKKEEFDEHDATLEEMNRVGFCFYGAAHLQYL